MIPDELSYASDNSRACISTLPIMDLVLASLARLRQSTIESIAGQTAESETSEVLDFGNPHRLALPVVGSTNADLLTRAMLR